MSYRSTLAVLASLILVLHAAAPVSAFFNETFLPIDGQVQGMPGLWDTSLLKDDMYTLIDSGRGADDMGALELYSEGKAETAKLTWDGSDRPVTFYYKSTCTSDTDHFFKVWISANDGTNWTLVYSAIGKELDPSYEAWTRVLVYPQPVMKDTPDNNTADRFSHQFAVRFSQSNSYCGYVVIDDLEFPAYLPEAAIEYGPPYVPNGYSPEPRSPPPPPPPGGGPSSSPAPNPGLTPGQQAGAAIGVVGGVTLATSIGLAIANQLFGFKIMCCRNANVSMFGKDKDPDQAGKHSQPGNQQPGKHSHFMGPGKLFDAHDSATSASNANASAGGQVVHGNGAPAAFHGSGTGPGLPMGASSTNGDSMV